MTKKVKTMEMKRVSNTKSVLVLVGAALLGAAVISGCSSGAEAIGRSDRRQVEVSYCEGAGEANESSSSAGEESGTAFTVNETYDVVRYGARLVMAYDETSNAFVVQ